ncbi:MAG: ligand-binding protein SH3, partial [Deltaproteobacteria bacterium]|nr:ligand-binding protein SH3 [Deltaproteobacteria bacterium]
DILAGFEYSGFTDTTLSIEAVNRHINGFDEALEIAPDSAQIDEFQWTARASRDYLNDTLTITLLISTFGGIGEYGAYQRFSADYDITDFIRIGGGIALYSSGDLAVFKNIEDNDRLFFTIKYSF